MWEVNSTSPDYRSGMLPLHQRGQLPYTPIIKTSTYVLTEIFLQLNKEDNFFFETDFEQNV